MWTRTDPGGTGSGKHTRPTLDANIPRSLGVPYRVRTPGGQDPLGFPTTSLGKDTVGLGPLLNQLRGRRDRPWAGTQGRGPGDDPCQTPSCPHTAPLVTESGGVTRSGRGRRRREVWFRDWAPLETPHSTPRGSYLLGFDCWSQDRFRRACDGDTTRKVCTSVK